MIPRGIGNVGNDEFSATEIQTLQSLPASGVWKIHQVRKCAPKCSQSSSQKRDGSSGIQGGHRMNPTPLSISTPQGAPCFTH